ncbi:hypothetical protein CerSpe_114020 [Prunus speciosa]
MAPFAKPLSFFFLIVLIFSSFENIQARESVFFSKVTHYNNKKNVNEPTISTSIAEVPTPAPSPAAEAPELADVPAPAPSYSEKEHRNNGALYGLGSGKSPSTEETPTTIDVEDEILAEELSGESFDRTGNYESTNLYNNNGYKTNYVNNNNYVNGNGYKTNYVNNNNYINGNGYTKTNNYKGGNGGENREINAQQGMSDTRFLENGRYYHDVINQNFNENYEAGRGSTRNYVEGYNGNRENSNEFNTMEEYDKYQESRGYVP